MAPTTFSYTPGRIGSRLRRAWPAVALAMVSLCAEGVLAQEDAAPVVPESGLYLNAFWLIFIIVCIVAWLGLTAWVSDDATGNGLKFRRWASIMLGAGGLGVICVLLVHPAFGFVQLICMGGVLALYIRERNVVVPQERRVLSRSTIVSPDEEGGEQREGRKGANVLLVNEAGQPISEYMAGEDGLNEAADVLADIVARASVARASAVRIEPGQEQYGVQFRLDGVAQSADGLPPALGQAALALLARFSQLADKAAAVGRMTATLPGGDKVDITVRGVKTPRGPAIVLTMPDWTSDLYQGGLSALGMHKAMVARLKSALGAPGQAVIISGPPSSGRTTTFEAAIGTIDIFVNDVIAFTKKAQHDLDQVMQREIDMDSEPEFREALRLGLREEPNIIGVDELTGAYMGAPLFEFVGEGGALVGTVQAVSSGQAVQRLLLSVDASLLSRTLTMVLNQRLLRKLCPHCKEAAEPSPGLLAKLKIKPGNAGTWFRPVGCEHCMNVGYLGRTALFELLIVNDAVRELIANCRVTPESAPKAAGKSGIRTLYQDGLLKVRQGITTLEEARRVLK